MEECSSLLAWGEKMSLKGKSNWKWVSILLVVAILFVMVRYFLDVRTMLTQALNFINTLLIQALDFISDLGPWGPILFVLLYVLATICFLPGFILTVGAGVLFGVIRGSVLVSVSSILGASLAFLIGRYLARDWVSQKIQGNKNFEAIDRSVAKEGWKIVGLTRLSPIFPFNLLNYAFGLTQVSLKAYFLASWVGMMPGTIMYVYIGSVAGDLAVLGAGERTQTPAEWTLKVVGLVATAILTLYITHIARKALREKVA